MITFACPRCGLPAEETYWGPCTACRSDLATRAERVARVVEGERYEPKMNVVPNQVAIKDD
jgi:hypothetical protein